MPSIWTTISPGRLSTSDTPPYEVARAALRRLPHGQHKLGLELPVARRFSLGFVKVSDLAERAGVTPSAIRFYEPQGILPGRRGPAAGGAGAGPIESNSLVVRRPRPERCGSCY